MENKELLLKAAEQIITQLEDTRGDDEIEFRGLLIDPSEFIFELNKAIDNEKWLTILYHIEAYYQHIYKKI